MVGHYGKLARLSKLLVIIALVSSLGLPWALLQCVAWVGMVVSYSQQGSFREALVKTFDGKHPCSLCKQIDQGKKSEKRPVLKLDGKQLDFIGWRDKSSFYPPSLFSLLRPLSDPASQLSVPPPSPPPRSA